ncbi:nuclear transport factor 2 family protein [Pseudonocardia sp. RS010]|uniref:nuclear transport factor 2 family protein n=1 Tax=Pseudonocardia sp. RS010 TaxID=3385979 RepID=UPI00399F8E80
MTEEPTTRQRSDGTEAGTTRTLATVERFLEAFGRGDVDAVMAVMGQDCVFESTEPPDGRCHRGRDEVRRCWQELFGTPGAHFTTEEVRAFGDRAVVRWRYSWAGAPGAEEQVGGHVRGVDLFTVRDGVVVEKLSYVKG